MLLRRLLSAAEAAALGWHLGGRVEPGGDGVRRFSWRVGDAHWLQACTSAEIAPLEREHALTERLSSTGAIAVPRALPTRDGGRVLRHAGHGWRLTAHIAGLVPDAAHDAWWRASVRGLVEMHAALRRCDAAPVEPLSTAVHLEPRLERGEAPGPHREAARWLRERWSTWTALPMQVVHGDWSTPNLRVDASSGRLCGVLDWESARPDPVETGLAQIASSPLMWTDRPDRHEAIAALPRHYATVGGTTPATLETLHLAMVAPSRTASVGLAAVRAPS